MRALLNLLLSLVLIITIGAADIIDENGIISEPCETAVSTFEITIIEEFEGEELLIEESENSGESIYIENSSISKDADVGIDNNANENINIDLIVSSTITIIGFIVTYFMTKKSFKDEIQKSKVSITLEKIEDLPFEIMNILTGIQKGTLTVDDYSDLLCKIYSYCSASAIKIAVKMQALNYENATDATLNYRKLTLLSLLISQVKYDLTSEIIDPEQWFILKISDYNTSGMKDIVKQLINEDVDELKLNKKFKVYSI